jgi:hypothetical protein
LSIPLLITVLASDSGSTNLEPEKKKEPAASEEPKRQSSRLAKGPKKDMADVSSDEAEDEEEEGEEQEEEGEVNIIQ